MFLGSKIIREKVGGFLFRFKKSYESITMMKQLSLSKFTLCPRGDLGGSYRIAEAAILGSIPVIQADFYPLPFTEIMNPKDWSVKLCQSNF